MPQNASEPLPRLVRVAAVQFEVRAIASEQEFYERLAYFVRIAGEYRADFVVMPELFTLQLLSCAPTLLGPEAAIEILTAHTERLRAELSALALRHRVNVVGGSHLTRQADGNVRNVCTVALRDGALHERAKIHPTPSERDWWGVTGGDSVAPIPTDCGPVGVAICYDVEFPEIGRRQLDAGVKLTLVPFCTDSRAGYFRVRWCAQARAVENQGYVVLAGVCGVAPNIGNMDVHFARSAVLTPCDVRFPRDGVAEEAAGNLEGMIVADLDMGLLDWARAAGSVRNVEDRRGDLYRVEWSPSS